MNVAEPVAVIGAGSAGLAAAQALKARGLPFTVFEAGSGVGGNWRYENDSGRSSAYASLRTNVSRQGMSYRCYPLRHGSLYPHHSEMLRYLEDFTDQFELREHIRFSTEVQAVRPRPDGGWGVTAEPGGSERFGAIVVATGYDSIPQLPDLPGDFDGLQLHTHEYRTPEPFAGLDVVVVGLGCSATELACEIRTTARTVTVAPRSGSDIHARRVGPIPIDWFDTRLNSRLPWALRRRAARLLFRLSAGDAVKAGLPAPPARSCEKPVAISDELLACVRSGDIAVSSAVVGLRGDHALTASGEKLPAQAILYGTGYRAEFPFLPAEVDPPALDRAELYRGIVSPVADGLFFIGLVYTFGGLSAVAEAQANWAAEVLTGRLSLPSREVMRESIRRDAQVRTRDFDGVLDVTWDRVRYIRALEREAHQARRRPGSPPRH
jgi:cation diffusion facilitator CzcD-associated flavoprotein CzcO